MAAGKLYGVGIGPGDPGLVTLRAAEILRGADVVFTVASANRTHSVSRAIVESLGPLRGEARTLSFSMSRDAAVRTACVEANAKAIADELKAGRDCAFATLGDAMTYSTFGYVLPLIRRALPGVEVEIVPGVTSFAHLAARAGRPLVEDGEELRVIPAFRAEQAARLVFPPGSATVLLKTYRSREALHARLEQEEDATILYGERLGMEGECLCEGLDAMRERPAEYLSLVLVKKR